MFQLSPHSPFTSGDLERFMGLTVGFDSVFNRLFNVPTETTSGGFPPYNIRKEDENNYTIEMAVAGFSKEDIEAELKEGVVTIRSKPDKEEGEFLHRGIAKRAFSRSFTLSDDMVVKDADLVNGMLTINLERVIPEEKKPQLIPIGDSKVKTVS